MSLFTGLSLATLQARYTEAQTAYHDLLTGKKVVSVGSGDKRVQFVAGEQAQLAAYLRQLQTAIQIAQGTTTTGGGLYSVATWTR